MWHRDNHFDPVRQQLAPRRPSSSFHVAHIFTSQLHSSDSSQSTSAGFAINTRTGYGGPLLHPHTHHTTSLTTLLPHHTSPTPSSAMSGLPERDLDPEELEQEEAFGESTDEPIRSCRSCRSLWFPADCYRRLVLAGFFHPDIYDHVDRECLSLMSGYPPSEVGQGFGRRREATGDMGHWRGERAKESRGRAIEGERSRESRGGASARARGEGERGEGERESERMRLALIS
jgi:hypothetical protein